MHALSAQVLETVVVCSILQSQAAVCVHQPVRMVDYVSMVYVYVLADGKDFIVNHVSIIITHITAHLQFISLH